MSAYDRRAWAGVSKKRDKQLSAQARRVVPERIRKGAGKVGETARDRARELPGAADVERTVASAIDGLTEWLSRTATASVRRTAVVAAYRRAGHPVETVIDLRGLSLKDIDTVKPRFDVGYMTAAAGSGAGAGLAITGGELGAGAGAIAGGGAGGTPAVGVVVGAIVTDSAVTIGAIMRLIAHTATYYGYDVALPEERLRAMAILNFATAGKGGKQAAYLELNRLMRALARNVAWQQLDQNLITKIVRPVYAKLTERLTKRKLASAAPLVGIAIGAGFNALALARAASSADLIYRERFLSDKYGLGEPQFVDEVATVDGEAEEMPLVEIIEETIASELPSQASDQFVLQFDPADLQSLAARYSYADDERVVAAGKAARLRGNYTRSEFLTVCRWKTPRSARRVSENSAAAIRAASKAAFVVEDPAAQIKSLTELFGVGIPTASTLLHFAFPDDFPILDVRALDSLGVSGRSSYSPAFWARYVAGCRSIAARNDVSLRTLDKALWQHSKESAG